MRLTGDLTGCQNGWRKREVYFLLSMMAQLNKSSLFSFLFLFLLLSCTYSISGVSHSPNNVDYGAHSIKIGMGEGFANFELNHSVDGYEVNCKKDLMMVWGKPVILNESNPQDSNLTIIDLTNRKIRKIIYFDKGIYDIDFLESPLKAIVWTTRGVILELHYGNILLQPESVDVDMPLEFCDIFQYKSFRRYAH